MNNPIQVQTLSFADLKSSEHLARNPMGSSPTFVDKDFNIDIWESGAVLTYLLEEYDKEYKLHPQPSKASASDRAKFLHIQYYIIATVYPFVASLYLHTLKPPQDQDPNYVKTATGKWKTLLAPTLENFFTGPYFLGEQMTAIDLLAAKPFKNAESMAVLQEFPKLDGLFQRIKCLPSFSIAYNETSTSDDDNHCERCRAMVLVPGDGHEEKKEG